MDFNKIALDEAKKSKCNKRKVGAVIVNRDKSKVLAKGYNFFQGHTHNSPIEDCEDTDGNTKSEVVHAEIAAINNILVNYAEAKYIYVTHPPCDNCQKAIDKVGLEVILVTEFMKFDAGKLQYSLVPPKAVKEMAKVLTYGAKKYKPNNWKLVEDTDRYVDALYRHLEAWRVGDKFDEESRLSHLSHALTNIAFLIHFEDIK